MNRRPGPRAQATIPPESCMPAVTGMPSSNDCHPRMPSLTPRKTLVPGIQHYDKRPRN